MPALRRMIPVYALLLWSLASARAAEPGVSDLIPKDSAGAIVVRNWAEFEKKIDKLWTDAAINFHDVKPSNLARIAVTGWLNLAKGWDDTRPTALILPNLEKVGDGGRLWELVAALPFTSADEIAANYGFGAGALQTDKLKTRDSDQMRAFLIKGRHLLVGQLDKAVTAVAGSDPLRGELSPTDAARLDKSDIAIHLGPEFWGAGWKRSLDEQEKREYVDAAEKDGNIRTVRALRRLRFVSAGLRLDDGLLLNAAAIFRKADPGAAEDLLSSLEVGAGASDLAGLPAYDPLFAYAAKGTGGKNLTVARALIREFAWFLRGSGGVGIIGALDSPEFFQAFDTWYKQLRGSRAVVYLNPPDKAEKLGALAVAGILDADDPEALIAAWGKLSVVLQAGLVKADAVSGFPAPKVTLRRDAEQADGTAVHVQTADFPGLGMGAAQEVNKLLGPDWNKMRLAVHGKHVVWTMGSDAGAVAVMLRNLKTGEKGLAGHPPVTAAAAKLSADRRLEVYVSARNGAALANPSGALKPGPVEALSAAAISVGPDRVGLDIWLPASEIKAGAGVR